MKTPWIAVYPGDFMNKTRHLSMAEVGAYWLLLLEYYTSGPIQARSKQVLRLCRSTTQEEVEATQFILSEFFVERDGFYHNARADEELEKRQLLLNKKVEAGRKGGKRRAINLADAIAHATAELGHPPSISPTHSHTHIESSVEGSKAENTQKAVEGGELPKSPPLKFSQSDFDERDWRKISAAKTKINEKLKGAMGGEPISEQQYHAWVAEESGVTVQRVMTLCKRNGGSNGTY